MVDDVLRIGHPFLYEDERLSPEVLRDDEVRARQREVVTASAASIVHGQAVAAQVVLGGPAEAPGEDRVVEEAEGLEVAKRPVGVER